MGRRADTIDEQTKSVLASIEDSEDPRQAWARVMSRIETLRKTGCDVPEALLVAERHLSTELIAQSQGR